MSTHHERLDLRGAGPGTYAVRSSSPTVYLLRVSPIPHVMRIHGGGASPHFEGDHHWWPLVELTSGPDLRGDAPDPADTVADVVRVGSRHCYVWDPGTVTDDQWRIGRVVESIEGPLTEDELAEVLGPSIGPDPGTEASAR